MVNKKKVLIALSNIDYSLGFIWLASGLDKSRFDIHFLILNPDRPSMELDLQKAGVEVHFLKFKGKWDVPFLTLRILRLLRSLKPQVVHAHLFDACMLVLPLARLTGVPLRVHTRHHSSFHHVYHPGMVVFDRMINTFSTHIVAISLNVQDILLEKEKVPVTKVVLIHHGFELQAFINKKSEALQFKEEVGAKGKYPVIGVISRYTEWKGVQYIIPAFKRLLMDVPEAYMVLANARGDFKPEISGLLKALPSDTYHEIEFEKDPVRLYSIFDIFVHVPVDAFAEAFGQTYVEALAVGVPSVFTLSGVAREFVVDKVNAVVVPFKNSDAIYDAMSEILNSSELRDKLRSNGIASVVPEFSLRRMVEQHEMLYEK